MMNCSEFLSLFRQPKPPAHPMVVETKERNLCGEISVVNADLKYLIGARNGVRQRLHGASHQLARDPI
jgi:hypothetical protein